MRLKAEDIQLRSDESFRLLRWQNNIHEVEIVAADGSFRPFVGSGHVWHHHSQMELTFIAQGSGTRFIGDSIAHFKAPDLVLIGPNLPHYWHMRHHSSGYAIQFDFDAGHPFWQLPETRDLRELWRDAQRGIHVTRPAARLVEEHIRAALLCSGIGRLTRFMQILEALASAAPNQRATISSATFAPPHRQATYRSLQKAIHLVFHRFQEDLSFADVLRETRMSKATFERHFRKHTGKTFTGFLAEVRLNFASRQLIETDLSVSEIALAAGFNTISHFNHQFLALHNQSPRTYRKALKARSEA
jgi:AraC-like DNA-binding protein/mannose-6-phosphate isomerase-like protein (cupin superfamily)